MFLDDGTDMLILLCTFLLTQSSSLTGDERPSRLKQHTKTSMFSARNITSDTTHHPYAISEKMSFQILQLLYYFIRRGLLIREVLRH